MTHLTGLLRARLRHGGVRGALALGGGAAAGQALALLCSPLLTRLYDVRAFGTFGTFTAVVSCLAAAATLRLDQAIVVERDEQGAEDVLRLCLLAVLGTAGLATLGALAWAAMGGRGWSAPVLALLGPAVAIAGAFPALSLWFARAGRFRASGLYQATRSGFGVLVQVLGGLALPVPGLLVGGQVAGQGLATAVLLAADARRLSRVVRRGWSGARLRAAWRRHLAFAVYGAPQALLRLVNTSLPVLLLPLLFGPAAAGLFWMAYRLLILPQQVLVEALRPVFFREAARLHAAGGDLQRASLRMAGLIGCLCLPVVLVLVLTGPWLFGLAFGPAWREAGRFAALIAGAWCLETMQMPSAVCVAVLGRQRAYLLAEAASLVLRLGALAAGGAAGSATLAVGLYALAWGLTNLLVIAWMARVGRADRAAHGAMATGAA